MPCEAIFVRFLPFLLAGRPVLLAAALLTLTRTVSQDKVIAELPGLNKKRI